MQQRTQIYLEPAQHAALLREARRLGMSLAGIIRKMVDEHLLGKGVPAPAAQARRKAALSLMGLGKSGVSDVSENTDAYLARAIHAGVVRERRTPYKAKRKA